MIEKYKMNFSYMSNTRVDNLEQEKKRAPSGVHALATREQYNTDTKNIQ